MKIFYFIRIWIGFRIPIFRRYFLTESEREKLYMLEFRSLSSLFGLDVTEMSDEEINQGIIRSSEAFSNAGLSVSEVAELLKQLNPSEALKI